MEKTQIQRQQELNDQLNQYRHEYYNLNAPTVSDEAYDRLFDALVELEQSTGGADGKFTHPNSRLAGGRQAGENRPYHPPALSGENEEQRGAVLVYGPATDSVDAEAGRPHGQTDL